MPAPFTNIWDTGQPKDSALANTLGQILRTFKLDFQQRSAAVSALGQFDPFPTYHSDSPSSGWNGRLFFQFPTTSGSATANTIYQYQNGQFSPTSIFTGSPQRFGGLLTATVTNTTSRTEAGVVTVPGGLFSAANRLRVNVGFQSTMTFTVNPPFNVFITVNGQTVAVGYTVEGGPRTNFGNVWGGVDTAHGQQYWLVPNNLNWASFGQTAWTGLIGPDFFVTKTTFDLAQPLVWQLFFWPRFTSDTFTTVLFEVQIL